MTQRLPVYFISHGGGPWPWIANMAAGHQPLAASLKAIAEEINIRPTAILMLSAHWETQYFTVMTAARPPMLYDYYNFPAHTYNIGYPAPGATAIAARAADLMAKAGLTVKRDNIRGFDHGCFVPLAVMYPDADIPVFQISIRQSYDPEEHIALGQALAPLRDEGVLVIGSGLSYHNLRLLGKEGEKPSKEFDDWLFNTLALPKDDRIKAFKNWQNAPSARIAHPREDHLVPLFSVIGAANDDAASRIYHQTDLMGFITASSYRFG